jgi:hypothetical protein
VPAGPTHTEQDAEALPVIELLLNGDILKQEFGRKKDKAVVKTSCLVLYKQ